MTEAIWNDDLLTLVETTGSTNDDARALAREGAPAGTAVAARWQSAGRGRRGHAWSSPQGNLYLSVVLRPQVPMQHFTGLSAVCALGVLDALREDAGVAACALKWPNDVVLGGGKLAGILVEAGAGERGPYAVCGVGVNVASEQDGLPGACPFESPGALPRACLADVLVPEALPGVEALARSLCGRVVARVAAWEDAVRRGHAAAGPLAPVLNEYFDAVPLLGRQVGVYGPEGVFLEAGVFAGVDCWGRATVRLNSGREASYAAEQVSLRPLA